MALLRKLIYQRGWTMDLQTQFQTSSAKVGNRHQTNLEYKALYLIQTRVNRAQLQQNHKEKLWMLWMPWQKQIQNKKINQNLLLPNSHQNRKKILMKRTNSSMVKRKRVKKLSDQTFQSTQWRTVKKVHMARLVAQKQRLRPQHSRTLKWWISKIKKNQQIPQNHCTQCKKWSLIRNHKLLWVSSIL